MDLYEKIQKLCMGAGISINALEKAVGIGRGSISRWNTNKPAVDKVQLVADYFDVSVDYLLGREDEGTDEIMELREQLRRQPGMRILFDASKDATKEQLESVAEMIKKWSKS